MEKRTVKKGKQFILIEDTTGLNSHTIGKVYKKSSDAGISLNGDIAADLICATGGSTNSGGNTNYFNFKDPLNNNNITTSLPAPGG